MKQLTVTPVDGSVYVERELAGAQAIENALEAAVRAQAGWRRVPVAERAAIVRRMVEWCVARADELGAELAWQMGRPDRAEPERDPPRLPGARAATCARIAEEALADMQVAEEGGLRALHPARAARRGAGGRAVELPLAHVGERGRAGAARRQQRDAQDGAADAARRRALRPSLRARPGCRKACSSSCTWTTTSTARVIGDRAHRLRRVYRLGARAGTRCSAPRPSASSRTGLELGGKDPAYVRADADSPSRSRTSSTAATSIPASRAAASSASTCTARSSSRSSTASSS